MKFTPAGLPGSWIIDLEPAGDERGFFSRTFCAAAFESHGLDPHVSQCSVSFNAKKGTLRGMHYQKAPHGEAKLVRCTRGAIYDVILDLRPDSPSYLKWIAVELGEDSLRSIYIPEGCAHGFETLTDETEVHYQMNVPYRSEASSGVRWDDPAFEIRWPKGRKTLSDKDRAWPLFKKENRHASL